MAERIIFHIDVNSAFLSWSAVKRLKENPTAVDLRTIPSAVGGDRASRHGIITAKSIPAKKYGVTTGEPVVNALEKCPDLVLVHSDFTTYREYSHAFIEILADYSPLLEQVSIDEAYLDVTDYLNASVKKPGADLRQRAVDLAAEIRARILRELSFTVNVGISNNKLLAKMASDFAKPDKTHTLFPEEVPAKMWPLPIRELYGCGKATAERLIQAEIRTIGDAAHADPDWLMAATGEKSGQYLWRSANGYGSDTVHPERDAAKSYSNETTMSSDITDDNYTMRMPEVLRHLSEKVAGRLARDGVYAQTITVTLKTSDFRRHSRQTSLPESTHDAETIYRTADRLARELVFGEHGIFTKGTTARTDAADLGKIGIRLVGVGGSNLDTGTFRQIGLMEWMQEKKVSEEEKQRRARLDSMLAGVREKYGKDALHKGAN